ncbi:MAG: hypothetical protein HDP34_03535 [Clostridia bacterium]|nr:hypothetical protein [Clostridia bacterium]
MQAKIFCRTVAKGKQSFYMTVNGQKYFLFTQDYRVSNKEYFQSGVSISEINNYSGAHSTAVRKTLDKLPVYIRYVEKEFGVAIYEKTKQARQKKNQKAYKRKKFLWQHLDWEVA